MYVGNVITIRFIAHEELPRPIVAPLSYTKSCYIVVLSREHFYKWPAKERNRLKSDTPLK